MLKSRPFSIAGFCLMLLLTCASLRRHCTLRPAQVPTPATPARTVNTAATARSKAVRAGFAGEASVKFRVLRPRFTFLASNKVGA
jgi:hypothetical protein